MKTILAPLSVLLAFVLVACGKDKFETKPRIEIKSYSSKEIHQGESLRIRLNYYDKEGDLDEGTFTAIRDRLNLLPLGPVDLADSFGSLLPKFPPKDQGEINFQIDYGRLKESTIENDTMVFRFYASDKAGNKTDTITSDKIVVYLP
ncbi:MAG TPA: hypothetical protein VK644_05235 [Chitinophagaceae bacterium]|nr:hypothetical protein [Chitinophagaceae bacterium]